MSKANQSLIDRAFARAWYYMAAGRVAQADAWFRLAFSLAELVG